MRFMGLAVPVGLASLVLAAHSVAATDSAEGEPNAVLQAVRSATSVAAHRVENVSRRPQTLEFRARQTGVVLAPRERGRLVRAVEAVALHPGRPAPTCIFAPAVEYRFSGGAKKVGFQVCFECGEVRFVSDEGVPLSGATLYGSAGPELRRITKLAFPEDPVIQGLR